MRGSVVSYAGGCGMLAFCLFAASCAAPHAADRQQSAMTAGDTSSSVARDRAAWNAWHEARIGRLTADDGWLTLIDLAFLEDGVTTIGRAAGNDLRYENLPADRLGRIVKAGKNVRFEPEQGAGDVTADGQTIDGSVTLVPDDLGSPTVIRAGSVSWILIRRNGRLALRVRDNASPVRGAFHGIDRFGFNPAFRIPARVEQPPAGATTSVTNVLGYVETEPLAAILVFTLDGREQRLEATEGGPGSLFVCFADKTNGRESYGAGRFLDVPVGDNAETIIDFNRAYTPPCAFTAFATCPLPTPANRLPIPIEAGERTPAGAGHGRTGS